MRVLSGKNGQKIVSQVATDGHDFEDELRNVMRQYLRQLHLALGLLLLCLLLWMLGTYSIRLSWIVWWLLWLLSIIPAYVAHERVWDFDKNRPAQKDAQSHQWYMYILTVLLLPLAAVCTGPMCFYWIFVGYPKSLWAIIKKREENKREEKRQQQLLAEELRKKKLEQERSEISHLAQRVHNIIENAKDNATRAEDSLWLGALLILYEELRSCAKDFEDGKLSFNDSRSKILELEEEAKVLMTPPGKEGEVEEPAKEDDYYYILGVNGDASQQEIRKAFVAKLHLFHPDKMAAWARMDEVPQQIKDLFTENTKKIIEAYKVLGDQKKRAEYDKKTGRTL